MKAPTETTVHIFPDTPKRTGIANAWFRGWFAIIIRVCQRPALAVKSFVCILWGVLTTYVTKIKEFRPKLVDIWTNEGTYRNHSTHFCRHSKKDRHYQCMIARLVWYNNSGITKSRTCGKTILVYFMRGFDNVCNENQAISPKIGGYMNSWWHQPKSQ